MEKYILCRLCIEMCSDGKHLYDEDGSSTDVYDTTVKYFDPMLLNSDKSLTAICLQCWSHICEFHEFQQMVYNSQSKLAGFDIEEKVEIKIEEDLQKDDASDQKSFEDASLDEMSLTEVHVTTENNDSNEQQSSEEVIEENHNSDNETSMMDTHKNKRKKCTKTKINTKKEVDYEISKISNVDSTWEENCQDGSMSSTSVYIEEDINNKDTNVDAMRFVEVNFNLDDDETNNVYLSEEKPFKAKERRKKYTKGKTTAKKLNTTKTLRNLGKKQNKQIVEKSDDDNNSDNKMDSSLEENYQDKNMPASGDDNDYLLDAKALRKRPSKALTEERKREIKEIDDFIARWKKDLECVICGRMYPNIDDLRKHFRDHRRPNQEFYVSCCERKFRHRTQIYEHIRFHLDPMAFKCEVCGKCCRNTENLKKHKISKHTAEGKKRLYECEICQKRFPSKWVLKNHKEIHKTGSDYVCKCGKGFATEERLRVHEKRNHNAERVCEQCGKTAPNGYILRQHILEHHQGIKKPKWPCDICNAELSSHTNLKRHKQSAHNDGSTVYICGECGKTSVSEQALQKHKHYAHSIKAKFKCSLCDKAFKMPIQLREHMATHTGEHLYTCKYCPTKFRCAANMYTHQRKSHPKEWTESRLNRQIPPKVDINQITNEVVL
ncbi:uncharacterized protein [Musca autumnalis]|uniref:uncharacterized protein n=1 Tax=Musca autumnalis TaxID=221902 RepID=UPI003CE9E26F